MAKLISKAMGQSWKRNRSGGQGRWRVYDDITAVTDDMQDLYMRGWQAGRRRPGKPAFDIARQDKVATNDILSADSVCTCAGFPLSIILCVGFAVSTRLTLVARSHDTEPYNGIVWWAL